MAEVSPKWQEEKDEVARILASGILGRSTNLVKMFRLVCERYFECPDAPVKEYTIAVEGFGRSLDFDPHLDPVVRVTAHLLRKRLNDFYAADGEKHALHILLPRGRYSPQFVRRPLVEEESVSEKVAEPELESIAALELKPSELWGRKFPLRFWLLGAAVVVLVAASVFGIFAIQSVAAKHQAQVPHVLAGASVAIPAGKIFRMLVGKNRPQITDHAGNVWDADRYCTEGESYLVTPRKIMGTVTPEVFSGGRRGRFHCSFPVPSGLYEAHLYFAETSEADDATQRVVFSFNGNPAKGVDVVDYAPGRDVATEKLIPALEPGSDGKINLDFWEASSFLNAIELIPVKTRKLAPIRINTADREFTDAEGKTWVSDRFFSGGRLSLSAYMEDGSGGKQSRSSRVGHFVYSIPVVSGARYTVRLLFIESWFGNQEGKTGTGKRIFDVTCNGTTLLKDFDVFAEGGKKPLVKSFQHIQPNGLGKIDLEFVPVDNYSIINAIEVVEE